jgi:hypothetical protein
MRITILKLYAIITLVCLVALPAGGSADVPYLSTGSGAPRGAVDRLAADDTARSYRTGEIDPFIERIPGSIEKKVFFDPATHLPELVQLLKKEAGNEYHLVKLIHDWITFHIAYDTDLFYGLPGSDGSRKPYIFLPLKRTTCGGFSALFTEMAGLAGLECSTVSGPTRTYWSKTRSRAGGHAWNMVKVNGKWYLVDTTADGRRGYKYRKFSDLGDYSDRQLFIKPEAKILVNFPDEPHEQLLDEPVSLEEFMQAPRFSLSLYMFESIVFDPGSLEKIEDTFEDREGGRLQSIYDSMTTGGRETITLRAPRTVAISASLYSKDDNDNTTKYPAHAFVESDGTTRRITFSPPGKGRFFLSIRARDRQIDSLSRSIYRIRVIGTGQGPLLPDHAKPVMQDEAFYYGISLSEWSEPSVDFPWYTVAVAHDEQTLVRASIYDENGQRHKKRSQLSHDPGVSRFYITPPAGNHWIRVYAKPEGAENYKYTSILSRVEHQDDPGTTEYPVERIILQERFHEYGLRIEEPAGPVIKPVNGIYRIELDVPPETSITASVKNRENETARDHTAIRSLPGGRHIVEFSSPGPGSGRARIYLINSQGKWNTAASFQLPTQMVEGPLLPTHLQSSEKTRFKSMGFTAETNSITEIEPGIFHFSIKPPAGLRMTCSLRDIDDNRFPDHAAYSTLDGKTWDFYFSAPGVGRYFLKIYGIDANDRWHTVKIVGVEPETPVSRQVPFPGKLFIYNKFHEYNLELVNYTITRETCRITIRAQSDIVLSGNLKDSNRQKQKDFYSNERSGNLHTFEATLPGNGRYNGTIWVKRENEYPDKGKYYFKFAALKFVIDREEP